MPYKSDAQRRYFHAAEARGEIKPSTVKEFDQASKGMKLKDHVKKLYEGGLIDESEYGDFNARYSLSDGKEQKSEQVQPGMGQHPESSMPSKGPDEYLTTLFNDYRDDAEPEEMREDEPSVEFLDALRRRKRS